MPKHTQAQSRQKALYRVKNWSEYDQAWVQRGSITFWKSDDFEKTWMHTGKKQRGRQFDNSDQAILVMLTIKEVFHLTKRGVEGFVRSLFWMMKINLPVPSNSKLGKSRKNVIRFWHNADTKS